MSKEKTFTKQQVQTAMIGSQTAYSASPSLYDLSICLGAEKSDIKIEDFYKQEGSKIIKAGHIIKYQDQVFVCYRGSITTTEALSDISIAPSSMRCGPDNIHMHRGFKYEFEQSEESMKEALEELGVTDKMQITFTGHSMGAALAQIAGLQYKANNSASNTKVVTFGGPRVFFRNAAKLYNKLLGIDTLLIQEIGDPVVHLPPPPLFSHAGFNIIKAKTKYGTLHQPSAYKNICENITEAALEKADEVAVKVKTRMDLIQDRKNLEHLIKQDRKDRIKEAAKMLYQKGVKEAASIILSNETRNALRDGQRLIDKDLKVL